MNPEFYKAQKELQGLDDAQREALASELDTKLGLLAFADLRPEATPTIEQMTAPKIIKAFSLRERLARASNG